MGNTQQIVLISQLMFTCVFQIIAIFEEQGAPPVPHNGGDGTSASSVGTSSPDIFQSREHINNNNNKEGFSLVKLREGTKNDVIVTRNDLNAGGLNKHSNLLTHSLYC